jgi:hypothetical protein
MHGILLLTVVALLAGCTAMAERGAVNDGSALSRAVGTTLSGAAGALLGQQTTGTPEGALLGGVASVAASEQSRRPSAPSTNNYIPPRSSTPTGGRAVAEDDVSKYACYYRGRAYERGETLYFVNDRAAAFSAPSELLIYGKSWSTYVDGDFPSLQKCQCGQPGWGCV